MNPSITAPLFRVVIADQHLMFAQGLEKLLAMIARIVGIALNGRDAVETTRNTSPDLVLLDLIMSDMGGIEAARQISRIAPRTRIVVLSGLTEPVYIRTALAAGATGYISKRADAGELHHAIKTVMAGRVYISPSLEPRLAAASVSVKEELRTFRDLTPRQTEVLKLIVEGRSRKEIAFALAISLKTVEYHRASIFDRLGIRTTAELTQYAAYSGLI
jgi:DNA-binding NarL/FixJ family response regulator